MREGTQEQPVKQLYLEVSLGKVTPLQHEMLNLAQRMHATIQRATKWPLQYDSCKIAYVRWNEINDKNCSASHLSNKTKFFCLNKLQHNRIIFFILHLSLMQSVVVFLLICRATYSVQFIYINNRESFLCCRLKFNSSCIKLSFIIRLALNSRTCVTGSRKADEIKKSFLICILSLLQTLWNSQREQ